jgi:N-acetylglucosaminyldiphosphoundecaprenol N-acetyl-beta-D-mannosaminyltransferase
MERDEAVVDGPSSSILGMRVDHVSYEDAKRKVLQLSRNGTGYVCIANVHMVMEAFDHAPFQRIVNHAALVTPDGVPLVWALRLLGLRNATRVYGPTLTRLICEVASRSGISVGFYGGNEEIIRLLREKLLRDLPSLIFAYAYAPPFRPLTGDEDKRVVDEITASGARVLFIGLGCPKQERWMADHLGKIPAVMIGVGAAFDFIAGVKPQAPAWMQKVGLEWLFRLATEPRRLWKRYLYNNPRFIYNFGLQLLGLKYFGGA